MLFSKAALRTLETTKLNLDIWPSENIIWTILLGGAMLLCAALWFRHSCFATGKFVSALENEELDALICQFRLNGTMTLIPSNGVTLHYRYSKFNLFITLEINVNG